MRRRSSTARTITVFEVAESIDMRTYPGTEYGPDAAPPSAARIQQISLNSANQRCVAIWATSSTRTASSPSACCGPVTERGSNPVSDGCCADFSCWARTTNRWRTRARLPTSISRRSGPPAPAWYRQLDQSADRHPGRLFGTACHGGDRRVNLAEKFPVGLPPDAEQDAFIKDVCTKMTDAYLAPIQLRTTTLTLVYSTVSLPSWTAGSHRVSSVSARRSAPVVGRRCSTARRAAADQRPATDPTSRHSRGTVEPAAHTRTRSGCVVFAVAIDVERQPETSSGSSSGSQNSSEQPGTADPAPASAAGAGSGRPRRAPPPSQAPVPPPADNGIVNQAPDAQAPDAQAPAAPDAPPMEVPAPPPTCPPA